MIPVETEVSKALYDVFTDFRNVLYWEKFRLLVTPKELELLGQALRILARVITHERRLELPPNLTV